MKAMYYVERVTFPHTKKIYILSETLKIQLTSKRRRSRLIIAKIQWYKNISTVFLSHAFRQTTQPISTAASRRLVWLFEVWIERSYRHTSVRHKSLGFTCIVIEWTSLNLFIGYCCLVRPVSKIYNFAYCTDRILTKVTYELCQKNYQRNCF